MDARRKRRLEENVGVSPRAMHSWLRIGCGEWYATAHYSARTRPGATALGRRAAGRATRHSAFDASHLPELVMFPFAPASRRTQSVTRTLFVLTLAAWHPLGGQPAQAPARPTRPGSAVPAKGSGAVAAPSPLVLAERATIQRLVALEDRRAKDAS